MKRIVILVIVCCAVLKVTAQYSIEYYNTVYKADSLYHKKEYKSSAITFSKAFRQNKEKGSMDDVYTAICSWALAGYTDSAFFYFDKLMKEYTYKDYPHIILDKDLISLYSDRRWQGIVNEVKANKEKAEKSINKNLAVELDSIYRDDQKYRVSAFDSVAKAHGYRPDSMKDFIMILQKQDSLDLSKVEAIINKYGCPGPDLAGEKGSMTVWLVLQHSNVKVQEKYLPLMKEAVKSGKARAVDLAYLEDRIEMNNQRPQIYGTQMTLGYDGKYNFYTIIDEKNVDERRARVGLAPLEIEARKYGIPLTAQNK